MSFQSRVCLLIVVIAWLATAPAARAQDKVRIGLSSIWVADEKGLFKKHGVDVELIVIGGGAARVVSSLIAGEIQFSVGGGDAVIRAALRGAGPGLPGSRLPAAL